VKSLGGFWISCWVIGVAVTGYFSFQGARSLRNVSPEDFVYYYAGTGAYWAGENPYDPEAYQARLRPLLGGENPFPSKEHAWLYPPQMAFVFAPFALLPGNPLLAYRVWSSALVVFALLLFSLLGRDRYGPPILLAPAILFASPAADNAFWTHRVVWMTLAACIGGIALVSRGKQKSGGAALALLGVQPQWWLVSAACLAAGRKWIALAVSAGLNAAVYAVYALGFRPLSEVGDYVSRIFEIGGTVLYSGNQSLAAGAYRIALFLREEPWIGVLPATGPFGAFRTASAVAFAAGAVLLWRSRLRWEEKSLLTVAFAVWVQPYTHGSEALWAIPGLLAAMSVAFPEEGEFSRAALTVLAGTVVMRFVLDFPGGRGFVASVYLLATLSLLLIARRRARASSACPG